MNFPVIEDTYAEAFSTKAAYLLITAATRDLAFIAASEATGFATSFIGCSAEAGVDAYFSPDRTPDGRPGYSIIICQNKVDKVKKELLDRIGQCVLTAPTTSVFNLTEDTDTMDNLGFKLSYFADGFQEKISKYGRSLYRIPVMGGDFLIEENFGIVDAVAGGNIFIMARTQSSALLAAKAAVNSIEGIEGVITPFPGGIVASGSKVGSRKYGFMHATTNEEYCPTLRDVVDNTKLPGNVNGVYEIVFDALNEELIEKATREAIRAVKTLPDVVRISAGNYGGSLGKYKIYLRD